jgi:hypothetical protein
MIHTSLAQAPGQAVSPAIQGGTTISTRDLNQAPMSSQEVAALKARRSALSDQLNSADGRRKELAKLVQTATGADKAGLEQRLGVLDARLARLETDIDENGKLLASTPAALASTSQPPVFGVGPGGRSGVPKEAIPIIAILSVFVFFPIAISIARNIWRRGSLPTAPAPDRESLQRLERMEQAMDAIAIEIERVSEGQRFVTRLLSEQRGGAALATGQPDGSRVPVGEKARL